MARVASQQWASNGLAHITHENTGQAVRPSHVAREPLDVSDQDGMSPKAIARKPHRLPSRATGGNSLRASNATVLIASNRLWSLRNGGFHRAEGFFRFPLIGPRDILCARCTKNCSQERTRGCAKNETLHVSAQTGPRLGRRGSQRAV